MKDALRIALKAVQDKKALDVLVLDVSGIASFADFFLICSGDSSRQIQAIADSVLEELGKKGIRCAHMEGYRNAEWVLLDYIDLVVHVFSKRARAYYDLERLWVDGKKLDVSKLLRSRVRKTASRKALKKDT
jgi:ribosome-associated protein